MRPNMEDLTAFIVGTSLGWALVEFSPDANLGDNCCMETQYTARQ